MPWTAQDRFVAISFNDRLAATVEGTGNPVDQRRMLEALSTRDVGGDGNLYACTTQALEVTHDRARQGGYQSAIMVITDGRSVDGFQQFIDRWRSDSRSVPVYVVAVGDVDRMLLDDLARQTGGRMFEGADALTAALRAARGEG
jgi:Ca-activated chloride channel family protein